MTALNWMHIKRPLNGEFIQSVGQGLHVPNNPIIPYITGDGIGPEVMKSMQEVVNAAIAKSYGTEKKIEWMEIFASEKAQQRYGETINLPDETVDAIQTAKIAIKGPLTTPIGKGTRSINVSLRQKLDLFVCLRPVHYFAGIPSPLRHPERVDLVIFRENTEDIYTGIEWKAGSPEAAKVVTFLKEMEMLSKVPFPQTSGFGIKPVSQQGTERLVRAAIEYARHHHRKNVTLIHKGNIMKFTEGAFRDWGYDLVRREYSDFCVCLPDLKGEPLPQNKILVKECICDAFFEHLLTRPEEYDVIVATNLNGDYISDAAAAAVGGIGIAPGANINYQNGMAVFEATHGTAPTLAGKNQANPCSLILSAEMMLRHLHWEEPADLIIHAIKSVIEEKMITSDFAKLMENPTVLGTTEFTKALIERL